MPSDVRKITLKSGAKRYQAQVKLGDRWLSRRFKRMKDANAWIADYKKDREQGTAVKPSNERFGDFLSEWLDATASARRENTDESYRTLIAQHVVPRVGDFKLNELSASILSRRLYRAMTNDGLSARTVRYTHSIVHNALDTAVTWRRLQRNPSEDVTLPRNQRTTETRSLTLDQARAFLDVVSDDPFEAFFHLAVSGGLRPSETMALRWSDIDLETHTVRVRASLTRTKGGKWKLNDPKTKLSRREVVVPESTAEALARHRTRQLEQRMRFGLGRPDPDLDFVFTNEAGNPLERHNLVRRHFKPAMRRLAEELGNPSLATVRLYDLRHTSAVMMLLAGVNIKVVSERLGHASVAFTLDTYAHVLPSMQHEAAAKLAEVLYGR